MVSHASLKPVTLLTQQEKRSKQLSLGVHILDYTPLIYTPSMVAGVGQCKHLHVLRYVHIALLL